jgi:hypothetical protein
MFEVRIIGKKKSNSAIKRGTKSKKNEGAAHTLKQSSLHVGIMSSTGCSISTSTKYETHHPRKTPERSKTNRHLHLPP